MYHYKYCKSFLHWFKWDLQETSVSLDHQWVVHISSTWTNAIDRKLYSEHQKIIHLRTSGLPIHRPRIPIIFIISKVHLRRNKTAPVHAKLSPFNASQQNQVHTKIYDYTCAPYGWQEKATKAKLGFILESTLIVLFTTLHKNPLLFLRVHKRW